MKQFTQSAAVSPEQLHDICAGSFRKMLVFMGIVTQKDSDFISERHVVMQAVSTALRNQAIAANNQDYLKSDNPYDFMGILTMQDHDMMSLLDSHGITREDLQAARAELESEQSYLGTLDDYRIPMIGELFSEVLDRPGLVDAALTLQQAVRSADTVYRLQQGEADNGMYYKRREICEYVFPKDLRLQEAMALHYDLVSLESDDAKPGTRYTLEQIDDRLQEKAKEAGAPEAPENVSARIVNGFSHSMDMFSNAALGKNFPESASPALSKVTDRLAALPYFCMERIGINAPMAFDNSRDLGDEPDPLTDPNFSIPKSLRSGPDRGDRDVEI